MTKYSKARYKIGDVLTNETTKESVLILDSYFDPVVKTITVKVKLLGGGYITTLYERAFYKHFHLDEKATILFGGGQKNGGALYENISM